MYLTMLARHYSRIFFFDFITPLCNCRPGAAGVVVFFILLFVGTLLWAKRQDPFSREWFTIETSEHNSLESVAVLPKPLRRCPVVIYAHESDGSLMEDGNDLRQLAELGVAAVSFEYDRTNEAAFGSEFQAVLNYITHQKWAKTNAIAWIGFSMGANRLWNFALQHPEQQPQLLVQLSGAGLHSDETNNSSKLAHCPVLLIHGDQDEIFPVQDTMRLASILRRNGIPVDSKIISNAPHDLRPNQEVIFRCIGEYCLAHLSGINAWQNYHSIAEWELEAPPFWLFCIPAIAWALGCFAWSQYRKPRSNEKAKLKRHEITFRWLAAFLATWALLETAIHFLTPHFEVSGKTLTIARNYLVQTKERADFEFLAAQPIWHEQKLNTLLEHVELANYNRRLVSWQLDDKMYQDYVLSPVITGNTNEQLDWRRLLWEEFYPRIRHEDLSEDAAKIVVRHLRERVTVANVPNLPHEVPMIWLRQITDKVGFEIIYVAALRTVGVPARLNLQQQAEFYDGTQWQAAPFPAVK